MSIVKISLYAIVMMMVCLGSIGVCWANESKDVTAVVIIDKSKEPYGMELKNEVSTYLEKELKVVVIKEKELQELMKNNDFTEVGRAEQPELAALATKAGAKFILVVEILPNKSDITQIVFYQGIKSEATLQVRLYDSSKQQYILAEVIGSVGSNKTYIPYTFVGKKVAVLESLRKAMVIIAQKVNVAIS